MDAPSSERDESVAAAPPNERAAPLPFYRAHKLLALSVALLFGSVGGVMTLSLTSCQTTAWRAAPSPSTPKGEAMPREEAEVLARVPMASLSNITGEPEMRVRLASGVSEVELRGYTASNSAAAGPVFLGPISGQSGPMRFPGPLRVRMTAEGWVLTDGAGKSMRLESPGELVVTADAANWTMSEVVPASERASGAPGAMVVVNGGAPYPGRIWLTPRSDMGTPAFDVIEHVGLEKYLLGVVVKEMYQNWPKEAFKVQAVCARTYALHERSRGQQRGRAFDVESTTRDQAYAGATTNRAVIDAVTATRGVVLAYNGEILRAYYSSTCGGRTASAKDTWPTTKGYEYNLLPPIQAHQREFACQTSPTFKWTCTRTGDDLVKRIRAFGEANQHMVRQIAGIHSLEVLETAPTGRPSVYKLIEPGGKWYRMRAEDLRLACNTSVPGLPAITNKTRVNSGDVEFKVIRPAGASRLSPAQQLARTTVEITGRGFGHGVGMCQYCARGMAARGDSWRTMLERFYPGAEIVKAYK